MIPYGRQDISQADIDAVCEVLRSDFLTQGPVVSRFEDALADVCGAQHAVAANSATSALHLACLALGLAPGDSLWTVPNTFVASANCGRYCGANVDFVDIDPLTWNMSPLALRDKLVRARREGALPKIVVPVHFAGQPTEQEEIWQLAQEFDFRIVEDASHAIGASRNGQSVGSCRWSDVTVFSFHPVKIVTSGEGGACVTNNSELAARIALLRSHGITRDPQLMHQVPEGAWYYEQIELGYNYRMCDIQAALGLSQLNRLREFVDQRNHLARRYQERLVGLPLQLPKILTGNVSAFHLYVVRMLPGAVKKTHREVFDELRQRGIGVNLHYTPVHLQPYYRDLGFSPGYCPNAECYSKEAITLPLYPRLSEGEQDLVISVLADILK